MYLNKKTTVAKSVTRERVSAGTQNNMFILNSVYIETIAHYIHILQKV